MSRGLIDELIVFSILGGEADAFAEKGYSNMSGRGSSSTSAKWTSARLKVLVIIHSIDTGKQARQIWPAPS